MSYEINKYAMLGVPVHTFVENLKNDVCVPIGNQSIYVSLDEKFDLLWDQSIPDFLRKSAEYTAKSISEQFWEMESWSSRGPKNTLGCVIASAAGLSDPVFYENSYFGLLDLGWFRLLPNNTVDYLVNGVKHERRLVEFSEESPLNCLAQGLSATNRLTVCDPLSIGCLKRALSTLIKVIEGAVKENNNPKIFAYERWITDLVNHYITDIYSAYDYEITVTSSRYGDVQDDGGMELDIPYLVVGDLQKYDKNGWLDPRKDNPNMVKDLQSLFFGKKSKQKFEVFEPSFGG